MSRPRVNIGICSVNNCDFPASKTGLCNKHYMSKRKYGTTDTIITYYQGNYICMAKNCNEKPTRRRLCPKHYSSYTRLKKECNISIEDYLKLQ